MKRLIDRLSRAAIAAGTLTLAACASQSNLERLTASPAQEFSGHLTVSQSGNWFRPCGMAATDSSWWVTSTGTSVEQIQAAQRDGRLAEGKPAFVLLRAVATTGGEIGPRGKGATALLLREVVTLRAPTATDCQAP